MMKITLWKKTQKLEFIDKLLSKSRLTEQDALELGRKIKKGIAARHDVARNQKN